MDPVKAATICRASSSVGHWSMTVRLTGSVRCIVITRRRTWGVTRRNISLSDGLSLSPTSVSCLRMTTYLLSLSFLSARRCSTATSMMSVLPSSPDSWWRRVGHSNLPISSRVPSVFGDGLLGPGWSTNGRVIMPFSRMSAACHYWKRKSSNTGSVTTWCRCVATTQPRARSITRASFGPTCCFMTV